MQAALHIKALSACSATNDAAGPQGVLCALPALLGCRYEAMRHLCSLHGTWEGAARAARQAAAKHLPATAAEPGGHASAGPLAATPQAHTASIKALQDALVSTHCLSVIESRIGGCICLDTPAGPEPCCRVCQ